MLETAAARERLCVWFVPRARNVIRASRLNNVKTRIEERIGTRERQQRQQRQRRRRPTTTSGAQAHFSVRARAHVSACSACERARAPATGSSAHYAREASLQAALLTL